MTQLNSLSAFFKAIANDPRVRASHISLYCALLQNCSEQACDMSISVMSTEIMKVAKISGVATYHKCIQDLHKYGYIQYKPSFNHRRKSKVYLMV